MASTPTALGRELNDSELADFHGSAGCTVYIIVDGRTGEILDVVPVGDCQVEHRLT